MPEELGVTQCQMTAEGSVGRSSCCNVLRLPSEVRNRHSVPC